MTHYNINYGNRSAADKQAAALADIRSFWGDERYERVVDLFKQLAAPTRDGFALQMSFAGVQGYPVTALYDHLWPNELPEEPAIETDYAELLH